MKRILFTALFAMCLYISDDGIINPDGDNKSDIQFDVYQEWQWNYYSDPSVFDNGSNKLSILINANSTQQFIPLSQFSSTINSSSFFYTCKKNISIPCQAIEVSNSTFSYPVALVYKSGGKPSFKTYI